MALKDGLSRCENFIFDIYGTTKALPSLQGMSRHVSPRERGHPRSNILLGHLLNSIVLTWHYQWSLFFHILSQGFSDFVGPYRVGGENYFNFYPRTLIQQDCIPEMR